MAEIQHIFVVAFENRSFDHLLGFSGIQGVDAQTGQPTSIDGLDGPNKGWSNPGDAGDVPAEPGAPFVIADKDPDHEFLAVREQLRGPNLMSPEPRNLGFVSSYKKTGAADPASIMKCFSPDRVPVLATLAREFAVCDRYFSSLPGPTWPNRFFLHAATSGGRTDSPSASRIAEAETIYGFAFEKGTLFDLLDRKYPDGKSWVVYEGDDFPQVWGLYGMGSHLDRFAHFNNFASDLRKGAVSAKYIFIEPSYGHVLSDYKEGSSQHPLDDIRSGEAFLKTVYESLRNSPLWENSLLVVTYDEHGGFPDHVPPPAAIPPGDTKVSDNDHGFAFNQLGVRVPAVLISPYIPRNTIDHTLYDHSSVPRTVETTFLGGASLTARDKSANTFSGLLTLPSPRTSEAEAPTRLLPTGAPLAAPPPAATAYPAPPEPAAPLSNTQAGFLYVAMLRHAALEKEKKEQIRTRVAQIRTKGQAHEYMEEVRGKVREARKKGRLR